MTLQASVRRSGGVCFQSRVRVERFFSVATACLFAALRTCSLIHRRVTGAWWSPRSSKPLPVRLPDRGRFDSYPLRLDSSQRHKDNQCPSSKPLSQVSYKARLPNLIVNFTTVRILRRPKYSKEVIIMSREQILKLTSLSSCAG